MKSTILYLTSVAPLALAASFEVPIQRRSLERHSASTASYNATKAAVQHDLAKKQARYLPELAAKNSKKRSTGSVNMVDLYGDSQYSGGIMVGIPGVVFNVVLDTGSSDLLLATAACTDCAAGTAFYDPSKSSTSVTSSDTFTGSYEGASAAANYAADTVSFGSIIVEGQTFGAATSLSGIDVDSSESGILGLGWQPISSSHALPLVQNMWLSNMLDEPLFAMAYAKFRGSTDVLNHGGVLSLGAVNTALYSGNINYNKLVGTPGYWAIKLDDVLINGVSVGINSNSVVVDSGSSLISMPASAVNKVYAAIGDSQDQGGWWSYPTASAPSLALVFGGVAYTVPSFSFGPASDTESVGIVYDSSAGTSDSLFVIGDAFLSAVMSVYNFEIPAVGFATLVDNNAELESGTEPTHFAGGAVVAAVATSNATASHATKSASHSNTAFITATRPASTASAKSASALGPLNGFGGALSGILTRSTTSSPISSARASSPTASTTASSDGAVSSSGVGRLRATFISVLLGACAFAALA